MTEKSQFSNQVISQNLEKLINENNYKDIQTEYEKSELHKGRLQMAIDQWTGKSWEQRAIESGRESDPGGIGGIEGSIPE